MNNVKKLTAIAALSVAALGVLAPAASASPGDSRTTAAPASSLVSVDAVFAPFNSAGAASGRLVITLQPFGWDWM